jgi:hypothetical protein
MTGKDPGAAFLFLVNAAPASTAQRFGARRAMASAPIVLFGALPSPILQRRTGSAFSDRAGRAHPRADGGGEL